MEITVFLQFFRSRHQSHLDFSISKHFLQFCRVFLVDIQIIFWIFFAENRQNLWQNPFSSSWCRSNIQGTFFQPFNIRNLISKILIQFYHLLCIFQILLSCVCGNHFFAYPLKKLYSIHFFGSCQKFTKGRLRNKQIFRRFCNPLYLRDLDDISLFF